MSAAWAVGLDVGGTFTDIIGLNRTAAGDPSGARGRVAGVALADA